MSSDVTVKQSDGRIDVDLVATQFHALDNDAHHEALLEAIRERDVYRKLVDELRQQVTKLENGLLGPKSHRFKGENNGQLSLQLLSDLLGRQLDEDADAKQLAAELARQAEEDAEAHACDSDDGDGENGDDEGGSDAVHRRKRKRTGLKTARADLPKITIEIVPDEVKRLGSDSFVLIGEDTATTIERRVSSLVEVTVVRKKFRAKTDEAIEAVRQERADRGATPEHDPLSWIVTAPPPELPIERGLAGPSLLANVAVRRFDDHLPYYRLENIYEREGMRFGRSTLYGWMDELRMLFAPLVAAMLDDAKTAPYVCTDATGVLVLAKEKCSRGHFWVLVAPERHVIFAFSHKHNSAAVDELLGDYRGLVVADAHSVYDHLFADDKATEIACWGHARAYFFKTVGSEPEIANEFLANLRIMFLLERKFAKKSRKRRERLRETKIALLVDRHFELCRKYDDYALDGTPLRAAITYSLNQEEALRRFLRDGRLPATNNISERQLRREATGRKNWLFVASNDGAAVNTTFTTLIASCHLHDIEPEGYLRDVMCLLPAWSKRRVLELAPCNWKRTRQQPETQQRLEGHLFRNTILELDKVHPTPV